MPIIGIDNDAVSSNFISSNLIDDSGIAPTTEHIKLLCEATIDVNKFVKLINVSTLEQITGLYNFFDQYCISRALIKLIELRMSTFVERKKEYSIVQYKDDHGYLKSFGFDTPFNKLMFATLYYYNDEVYDLKESLYECPEINFNNDNHSLKKIEVILDDLGLPKFIEISYNSGWWPNEKYDIIDYY